MSRAPDSVPLVLPGITALTRRDHAQLTAAVEPIRLFRWFWDAHKPFQGEVAAEGFRVLRVLDYRNSFVPVLSGRVNPTPEGARIEGTMTLHPAAVAFMALWLGFVLLIGLIAFGVVIARGAWNPMFLVPFGMVLFGWAAMAGGFTFEARLSLRRFREIVAAEPDTPAASPAT